MYEYYAELPIESEIEVGDEVVQVADRPFSRTFKGRGEALIQLGIVERNWLPGQPGRNLTCQSILFDQNGENPEFIWNRGGSLRRKKIAKGRVWMRMQKCGTYQYTIERAYLPSEAHLSAPLLRYRAIDLDLRGDGVCELWGEESRDEFSRHHNLIRGSLEVFVHAMASARRTAAMSE